MHKSRKIELDPVSGDPVITPYFAVRLSEVAYKDKSEAESLLSKLGYNGSDVVFFHSPLATGFIIRWGKVVAMAFRGSSNLREWLNNLNVWPRYTPVGRVHAGYYNAIESVGPQLYSALDLFSSKNCSLLLTGHSRGGALAVLFAGLLKLNGFRIQPQVYTFGSPKGGTKRFAKFYEGDPLWQPYGWSFVSWLGALMIYLWTLTFTPIFLLWFYLFYIPFTWLKKKLREMKT